jgi:hypothetical protein
MVYIFLLAEHDIFLILPRASTGQNYLPRNRSVLLVVTGRTGKL